MGGSLTTGVRSLILVATAVAAIVLILSRPPIPQPASYHDFADQRAFLGLPNAPNVISNVPFLFVGIWGLFVVTGHKNDRSFLSTSHRVPYAVFFLGVALTFFGSSYYHLHPTNARLVWDRLPMTLGFMGILSSAVAERINLKVGTLLLAPLVVAGILSVTYWYSAEVTGHGDLRPYLVVQFGSLLLLLGLLIFFPSRYTESKALGLALALYVAAKLCESLDPQIYAIGHAVSGHTLKHLAAALAAYFVVHMLRHRTRGDQQQFHPVAARGSHVFY